MRGPQKWSVSTLMGADSGISHGPLILSYVREVSDQTKTFKYSSNKCFPKTVYHSVCASGHYCAPF